MHKTHTAVALSAPTLAAGLAVPAFAQASLTIIQPIGAGDAFLAPFVRRPAPTAS